MSEVNGDCSTNQDKDYNDNENFDLKLSPRSKQRQFVSGRLWNLKSLDPKIYSEIMVQPILQVRLYLRLIPTYLSISYF